MKFATLTAAALAGAAALSVSACEKAPDYALKTERQYLDYDGCLFAAMGSPKGFEVKSSADMNFTITGITGSAPIAAILLNKLDGHIRSAWDASQAIAGLNGEAPLRGPVLEAAVRSAPACFRRALRAGL